MPRIRSIKPQFWTSEQVADCSPNARLLFVGLWSFADDYGVHPASVARLKMEVFPGDPFKKAEVRALVDELLEVGLLKEYEVRGERYWLVTGWEKHQKPDTKTGLYPLPDGQVGSKIRRTNTERSPNETRTFADHSPPEKEKEKEKGLPPPSQPDESIQTPATEKVHGGADRLKNEQGVDDEF